MLLENYTTLSKNYTPKHKSHIKPFKCGLSSHYVKN